MLVVSMQIYVVLALTVCLMIPRLTSHQLIHVIWGLYCVTTVHSYIYLKTYTQKMTQSFTFTERCHLVWGHCPLILHVGVLIQIHIGVSMAIVILKNAYCDGMQSILVVTIHINDSLVLAVYFSNNNFKTNARLDYVS